MDTNETLSANNTPIPADPILPADPTITDAQYLELITFRQNEMNYKAQGFDVLERIQELEKQLSTANAQAAELRQKAADVKDAFTKRFREIIVEYGFGENDAVVVSDTAPHYIARVDAQ